MRTKQSFKSRLHLMSIMGAACLALAALILSVVPSSSADSVGTVVHVNATGEDDRGRKFEVWVTCYLYGDNFAFGNFSIATTRVNRGMLGMYPYAFGSINEAVVNGDGTITVAGDAFSFPWGRESEGHPFTLTINRHVVDNIGAVTYQEPDSGIPALHITLLRGEIERRSCGQRF